MRSHAESLVCACVRACASACVWGEPAARLPPLHERRPVTSNDIGARGRRVDAIKKNKIFIIHI